MCWVITLQSSRKKGSKMLLQMHYQERMRTWKHFFYYLYYPTGLDKRGKGWMEILWRSVSTHSKVSEDPSSSNITRTWRGRKNHIGTWSNHRNKKLTTMKLINFRVSHKVEELTCWRFHMGQWEFYIESSRTIQALRTTNFEGKGLVRSRYH